MKKKHAMRHVKRIGFLKACDTPTPYFMAWLDPFPVSREHEEGKGCTRKIGVQGVEKGGILG
ncbi:hypothetical protein MUO79_05730 [Candidatus Bathyarchaeota archaeon]|nr:hypothetical protein [Candidatus Bathyarchaeota archaeon]